MSDYFKEIPEVNPKTEEKTKMFACLICGAVTVTRKVHLKWHKSLNDKISVSPYWDGVDNLDI